MAIVSHPLPQRGSPLGISALVVGAGVAGLYAALELWRQGVDVTIIERAPSRLTAGDGFTISHQIVRSFRNWPYMAKRNEEIAFHPCIAWHKITGERVTEPISIDFRPSSESEKENQKDGLSADVYRHSRPLFHLMLETQLEMVGLKVQYGKRVMRYIDGEPEENRNPGIEMETGEILEAELVIAADGIGSHSTKVTLGHEVRARATGLAIYRATYPLDLIRSDDELMERFKLLPTGQTVMELWLGDEIFAAIGRGQDEITWTINHKATREAAESWSKHVSPQQVIDDTTSKIEGWPEYANRLILATPKDRLIDFELVWRDPQPVWTSPSGRIVQIGDAAHTFLPTSGNGANQGLEDAISLAKCLKIAGRESISEATKVHNKLRFERVSCLQKIGIASQATQYGQKVDGKPGAAEFKHVPKYVRALTASWIWKHEPEEYAEEKYHEALAALKDGVPFQSTNIPEGYVYEPWTFEEILKVVEETGEYELGPGWWN